MALSGWPYYATATITGSTDGALTNKVIWITIPYQSFMNSDFSDIRFCASDGETLLSHNRVSYTTNSSASFAVKIPSLPASPSTYQIYVYAGNSAATDASDPANVYLAYDPATSDNSSRYTLTDIFFAGTNGTFVYDSTNKRYTLTTSADDENFVKINSLTGQNKLHLEFQIMRTTDTSDQEGGVIIQETASNNYVRARYITNAANRLDISPYTNGSDTTTTSQAYTITQNVWYTISIDIIDTSLTVKWYDSNKTLLYTLTATLNSVFTNGSFGFYGGKRANAINVFKNVVAWSITTHEPTVGSLSSWTQSTSSSILAVVPAIVSIIPYGGIIIEDANGIILSEIDYAVQRGTQSNIKEIVLVNQSSAARTVTLTPTASTSQEGSAVETYNSQFLSSDGTIFTNTITVTVPSSGTKTIYTKYAPPDNTVPGSKQWKLASSQQYSLPFNMPAGWNYVSILPITGSGDGSYTNALITVQIPFVGTVMNANYSDIRFYTMDGTQLSYQLVSTVGGSGTFTVLIPSLLGSPTITKLFVLAGNEDATTTSTTVTGTTPTTTPTVGSLGSWNYYGSLECKADVQYTKQEIEGLDYTPSFIVKVGGVKYE